MRTAQEDAEIFAIERPDSSLWTYYLLRCLATGPAAPVVLLISWFRYSTMRYEFKPDGLSMRWGILFRREIILQYARIQDIHLQSNVVERWLGLSRVLIQTASGNASAEMTLEGLKNFEAVRDFLYSRMRGVQSDVHEDAGALSAAAPSAGEGAELAALLREVAQEVRNLRETLAQPPSNKDARA